MKISMEAKRTTEIEIEPTTFIERSLSSTALVSEKRIQEIERRIEEKTFFTTIRCTCALLVKSVFVSSVSSEYVCTVFVWFVCLTLRPILKMLLDSYLKHAIIAIGDGERARERRLEMVSERRKARDGRPKKKNQTEKERQRSKNEKNCSIYL